MAEVINCTCSSCAYNDGDGNCERKQITISDNELRADGFYPRCRDFESEE